jgi:hypothetical protein
MQRRRSGEEIVFFDKIVIRMDIARANTSQRNI